MGKKVFISFFLLTISLPLLLSIFGIRFEETSTENRQLAQSPVLQWESQSNSLSTKANSLVGAIGDYKEAYKRFYEDHFVLKPLLFSLYYHIQTQIFDTNPLPQKVVKGSDGWYFLGNSFSNALSESKGISNFTERQLKQIRKTTEKRSAWLKQHGMEYYVAVAPNKHSVYGNFLPITQNDCPTKLNQVKEVLANSPVKFIDLSEYIRDSSHALRLYDKTGTHWNQLGGYLGYKRLIKDIAKDFPQVKALTFSDFSVFHEISTQEGLTKMLAIHMDEDKVLIKIKNPEAVKTPRTLSIPKNYPGLANDYEQRFTCPQKPLKVLVFRDSFSNGFLKLLIETFGETVLIWSYDFDPKVILQEKPDIVISEIVERNIEVLLKDQDNNNI